MDITLAKRIWSTDDAYVKINNYFVNMEHIQK